MSDPGVIAPRRSPGMSGVWTAVLSGAVFLASGAALVVHIVTGAPLPLVLALLVAGGGAGVALALRADPAGRRVWRERVLIGLASGFVATLAYDGSRWLLVNVAGWHASPFAAWGLFGRAILGDELGAGSWGMVAGLAFHLVNGCAFGIAYTVWFGHRSWWWGIAFAFGLEAFMLAIYPGWLNPASLAEFTQMSAFGHLVYGVVLGVLASRLVASRRPTPRAGHGEREAPG